MKPYLIIASPESPIPQSHLRLPSYNAIQAQPPPPLSRVQVHQDQSLLDLLAKNVFNESKKVTVASEG